MCVQVFMKYFPFLPPWQDIAAYRTKGIAGLSSKGDGDGDEDDEDEDEEDDDDEEDDE